MSKVRANADAIVRLDGVPTAVREGQAFDDTDPVVRQFAWLFESPVESATAEPGERRSTTTRRKS